MRWSKSENLHCGNFRDQIGFARVQSGKVRGRQIEMAMGAVRVYFIAKGFCGKKCTS